MTETATHLPESVATPAGERAVEVGAELGAVVAELSALVDVLAHLGVVGRRSEAVVAVADEAGALRQRGAVLAAAAAVRAARGLALVCWRRGNGRQVRHENKREGGGSDMETWRQTGDTDEERLGRYGSRGHFSDVYRSQNLGGGWHMKSESHKIAAKEGHL